MRKSMHNKDYMGDINMTPMIDIMLVLLVIFMITAPMLVTGIDVDIPKTKQVKALKENEKPIIVSLTGKAEIYVGSMRVEMKDLREKLMLIAEGNKGCEIFMKADRKMPYGNVMNVMGKIVDAGFEKVSLVTDVE